MSESPVTITVKVDVDAEIARIAKKDGVETTRDLLAPLTVVRKEYYRACVYAHYQGYDQGYLAAMRASTMRSMILRALGAGVVLGALLGAGIVYAVVR